MLSSGMLWPRRTAAPQNWQPRPPPPRDLDDAQRRAVAGHRNLIWTFGARAFDHGRQGLTPDGGTEQLQDQVLSFAVHQTIDAPFLAHPGLFDLPGARASHEDL